MVDVNHFYGGDLTASATGDLSLADLPTTGLQRVYRRLLTNPQLADVAGNVVASADYMSHTDYGAGLPRKIGSPQNVPVTEALIKGQMFLESAVTQNPPPKIALTPISNGLSSVIQYQDANSATPQLLQFDITK